MPSASQPDGLPSSVKRLYDIFRLYPVPGAEAFCGYCHTPDEIDGYRSTPLHSLEVDSARALLWETADHWGTTEAYKHYLPRLLEVLAPPHRMEDLYPAHLFETLRAHHFRNWPPAERAAILDYVTTLTPLLAGLTPEDVSEWNEAIKLLE